MKIRYVHATAPKEERIHDTVVTKKNCAGLLHLLDSQKTQEEWDKDELLNFERDKKRGLILSYNIVKQ